MNPKEVQVILDRIPTGEETEGKEIELKDIYYDFDKWYIRPESEPQLRKLLVFMENPDAIVEIGSHTDAPHRLSTTSNCLNVERRVW